MAFSNRLAGVCLVPAWARIGAGFSRRQPDAQAEACATVACSSLETGVSQGPPQLAGDDVVRITAVRQEKQGQMYLLRGKVEIQYRDVRLTADEVDYSEETQVAEARGNVRFERPSEHEEVFASRGRYNVDTGEGEFFDVRGASGAQRGGRNVLLTTTNPYFFEARKVDRRADHAYVVHRGYVTSCRVPQPLWTFHSGSAIVHPGRVVHLRNSWFRIRKIPVVYSPYFRHSLERIPRSTGFLTPNFGTSSRKGRVFGESFFWAINRSADALIGAEYYSMRGWAQRGTFRWRPAANAYLDASYFGVVDRGQVINGVRGEPQSGRTVNVLGSTYLPHGFRAVANVSYLSSLAFRFAFTESYNEAVGTEVHSAVFLTNHFRDYDFHVAFLRAQNFQSARPKDSIEIRSLPSVQFSGRERQWLPSLPLWFAFDTAADVMSRSDPQLDTGKFVSRFDVFPRVTMPLKWGHVQLTPTVGFRATHYGSRLQPQTGPRAGQPPEVSGENFTRFTKEVTVDLRPPALFKVFHSPGGILGDRWKHTIEPQASFRYVDGVRDYDQMLRFDERDILVNTREIEYSLTQRLYYKRDREKGQPGATREFLTWELRQRYFFDPTFGGVLQEGRRNVFAPSVEFSGYAFLDRPRRFSPVTSLFRMRPSYKFDTELRMDYDPDRRRLVSAGLAASFAEKKLFATVGHYLVRTSPILAAPSNQIRGTVGYGRSNQLGPNIVWLVVHDVRNGFLQYSAVQASYNVDCCGITIEWRRFAFGPARNENQWRMAFSLANIGTFGNIKKQERLF